MPSATNLTSPLRDPRALLRRARRRHRRPLAAALAGVATLLALTALRAAPEGVVSTDTGVAASSVGAVPGRVTLPVTLGSGAVAAVLQIGDVIDLVSAAGGAGAMNESTAPAAIIARGARVIALPLGGSALGGSSSAVILVSLPEADALRVVTSMGDGLTPVIRSR